MRASKFLIRLLAVITATSLLMASFVLPLRASASPHEQSPARVDSLVLQQLAAQNETTFWVVLREKADLSPAFAIRDWNARGLFVIQRLQAVANSSQAEIRGLLQSRGVEHRPFWIANTIRVTAGQAILQELRARPEVEQILADEVYEIPPPEPGKEEPTVQTVEWGIDRIRAPLVWSTFNDRGDGIVIANIDTGVLYNHAALVRQYRGNLGGGSFDHNYNWFDPSNVCGNPSLVPCDNNGHGTHTMGTMAGDDGDPGTNQIGVAPHVKWIAAKGCETSTCSDAALLASGQWVLAPTDLSGQNPRPDLRPHIVNNSWGNNNGSDTFYQATVQAWIAAGIFPAFSNGNAGSACGTVGSPASYPQSYGTGSFDINNAIATTSSRGPAPAAVGGEIKPDIAAPGVNIRSSWNNGAYNSISGTSMASPHTAGTVALMWSAAPSLIGDVALTRSILDQTAIDTSVLTCGGTAANNNVWGEGRLDAFAAVDQSPRGPTGTLNGVVTDSGNTPIAGATVHAAGPTDRTTITDAAGAYSFLLPIGTYDVSASAFGYLTQTANGVVVSEGGTTTQDFTLQSAPSHQVSGYVRDTFGQPIANATVTIQNTPISPTTTDSSGFYSFASVPEGTYNVRATAGRCNTSQTQSLVVDGDEALDFALAQLTDSFGYFCRIESFNFIDANTVLPLTGDDASTQVSLPFPFTYYGQTYTSAFVATNGHMNFLASNTSFSNSAIPSTTAPNGAIYPFWDDLVVDASSSVRTQLLGMAPLRQFVIEWRNVRFLNDTTRRIRFEVVLHENSQILTQYTDIANDAREQGNSATVGIENHSGTVALQYSLNEAAITNNLAVRYRLPPQGFLEGVITDYNDGLPIAGATVRALQGATVVRQTTTDANGFYRMLLSLGSYTAEASATNYSTESAPVVLDTEDAVVTQDFAMKTARAEVSPASFQFILPASNTRTRNLTLHNTGSALMTWSIVESPAVSWLSESPSNGTLAVGDTQLIALTADSTGLAPGVYDTTLLVQSNSGRQPSISVPFRLIVPAYRQGVNSGGGAYTDVEGDSWAADQAYASGSWGYANQSTAMSTKKQIAGTEDDPLFQKARRLQVEYRFDGLPNGVYQIELNFAEIQGMRRGQRVFDVTAEGVQLLLGFDIAAEVGLYTADYKTFFVVVTDGQLNLRFLTRRGYGDPIINAIRVTHRPDQ